MPADLLAIIREMNLRLEGISPGAELTDERASTLVDLAMALPALIAYVKAADACKKWADEWGMCERDHYHVEQDEAEMSAEVYDTARAELARQLNGGME